MAPEQTTFADIAERTGTNEPGGTVQSPAEPDTKAELVERAQEYAAEVAANTSRNCRSKRSNGRSRHARSEPPE